MRIFVSGNDFFFPRKQTRFTARFSIIQFCLFRLLTKPGHVFRKCGYSRIRAADQDLRAGTLSYKLTSYFAVYTARLVRMRLSTW